MLNKKYLTAKDLSKRNNEDLLDYGITKRKYIKKMIKAECFLI